MRKIFHLRYLLIILLISLTLYIAHLNDLANKRVVPVILEKKLILLWTSIFGFTDSGTLIDCPPHVQKSCILTHDRALSANATAIVFHIHDFSINDVPKNKMPFQKYVFMSMEAPPQHSKRHYDKLKDFFDWTMTYRLDSDIPMRYGSWWVDNLEAKRIGAEPVLLETNPRVLLDKKELPVFWLVSNCNTYSKREIAVKKLSKFIQVDIMGRCGKRRACPRGTKCEQELGKKYYFYVAAENALCKDYITEKYWDRIELPSVPIILKRKYYEGVLPPQSFIAMDDFNSAKEMADYLKKTMQNETEFLKYFEWRKLGLAKTWQQANYTSSYCRLCEMIIKNPPSKPSNWKEWFFDPKQCEGSKFATEWRES